MTSALLDSADHVGDQPQEVSSGFDFIEAYAEYADVLEAPRSMHEFVALDLLATVLNLNQVVIQCGAINCPLDVWIVLLSGSGGGRSTLITLATPIVEKAGLADIIQSGHWGSPQAFYQHFAEHPYGISVWGELSVKLKLFNDPTFRGAKEWLTDRYDNLGVPEPITYRDTGKRNRDTPPIIFQSAPRINILATSSEEWFFSNLVKEDSAGGFVPRWIIVRSGESDKVVPIPRRPDEGLIQPLADHLQRVSRLKGSIDLSAILPDYDKWYRDTRKRFRAQPSSGLADVYFNRHRLHILKLASLYEVSRSATLQVSKSSWDRAEQKCTELEQTLVALLPTAMSKEGHQLEKMADKVRSAGANGLSLSKFTISFQSEDARDRKNRLQTLFEGERIYAFSRVTMGRTGTYLVHSEWLSEYHRLYPTDQHTNLRCSNVISLPSLVS